MCACRRCRHLLSFGLAVGVLVLHESPHAHVPTLGEQAVTVGKVAIVRSSSGSTRSGTVTPEPVVFRATVLTPKVTAGNAAYPR